MLLNTKMIERKYLGHLRLFRLLRRIQRAATRVFTNEQAHSELIR